MKRITNLKDTIGKTISSVSGYANDYIIAFTDNSFLNIQIEWGYEDSSYITFEEEDFNRCNLVEAELITKEDYEEEKAVEVKRQEEERLATDRGVYEMLKARFEPVKGGEK